MTRIHDWLTRILARNRDLVLPLSVAVGLRVTLMLSALALTGTEIITQGDTTSYLEPGRNLMQHWTYSNSGMPEIDRTPGYPIFAMLTGMAFGQVWMTIAAQILVSLASLLLICKIAGLVFPIRRAGAIAAWLYAIEPVSVLYTARIMPETLFVFFLLAAMDRLLVFQKTARLSTIAFAGVFLATATYVRPVSYYLALPIALALPLITAKAYRWKAPAVLLMSTVPLLALWQVRNFFETGYSGFSSIVEKNLYFYQAAEVTAELQHFSLIAQQQKLGYLNEAAYLQLHPDQQSWTQVQRLHFMRAEAVKILSTHRALYLKTHMEGIGVVAFTPCASELMQLLGAYPPTDQMPRRLLNEGIFVSIQKIAFKHPTVFLTMAAMEVLLVFLYNFAGLGVARGEAGKPELFTLIGIALYFLIISGGAQAVGRYRLPVMPEVCILAAGGLASVSQKKVRSPKLDSASE